jgi:hypothetical protein
MGYKGFKKGVSSFDSFLKVEASFRVQVCRTQGFADAAFGVVLRVRCDENIELRAWVGLGTLSGKLSAWHDLLHCKMHAASV